MRERKPEKGKRLAPLSTGRNAAFAAVQNTLAPGERTALELTYSTRRLKKGDFSDELVIRADGKDLKPILLKGTIE